MLTDWSYVPLTSIGFHATAFVFIFMITFRKGLFPLISYKITLRSDAHAARMFV